MNVKMSMGYITSENRGFINLSQALFCFLDDQDPRLIILLLEALAFCCAKEHDELAIPVNF